MDTHATFLFVTIFLATAVEILEVVAILLGVGLTRGWMATIGGAVTALVLLGGIIAGLGSALTMIPISALRATVGILLLLFGAQWLRKGIMRLNLYGFKAHVSDKNRAARPRNEGFDWTAFVVAFKGVLLEGLEAAFVVVTFGTANDMLGLASVSAGSATLVIALPAVLMRKRLQLVPGHIIKFAVGLLLVTFGTFWAAEGLGVTWLGEDWAILGLLTFYFLFAIACVSFLRYSQENRSRSVGLPGKTRSESKAGAIKKFGLFWYRFLVGDDWVSAVLIVSGFLGTALLVRANVVAYWFLPVLVILSVSINLFRQTRAAPVLSRKLSEKTRAGRPGPLL